MAVLNVSGLQPIDRQPSPINPPFTINQEEENNSTVDNTENNESLDFISNALGIKSPTKYLEQYGIPFTRAKSNGVEDEEKMLTIEDVKNGDDMIDYLKTHMTSSSLDNLINYYLSEQSNVNQYNRDLQADATRYQRLVNDLKAAGLNPWLAVSSLNAGSVSSGSSSYGTTNNTTAMNSSKKNSTSILNTIIRAIASIAGALIGSLSK